MRCLLFVGHCALRRPARVRLRSGAVVEVPPTLLRGGSGAIFVFRDDYEVELAHLDRIVKPGCVFVDGGANLGIFSAAAATLAGPDGTVLAFEPARDTFANLQRNVGLGNGNIRAYNVALADTSGHAQLFHVNGGPVGYSLGRHADGAASETVRTVRLDDVVAEAGIDRVDVVKLDVEGAEEVALRGATDLLSRCRPTVLFELQPAAPTVSSGDHDGAWQLLAGLGYQLFAMDDDGELVPIDRPRVGNNIAVAG